MTLDDLTPGQLKTLRDQAAGMARTFGRRRGLTAEDIEDVASELQLYLCEHVGGFDPTRAGFATYCQRRAQSALSKRAEAYHASKRFLDRTALPLVTSGPDGYDLGDFAVRWRTPPPLRVVAAEAASPIIRHGRPVEIFDRSRPSPIAPKPWARMGVKELRRQLTARGAKHKSGAREELLRYMDEAMKDDDTMPDTLETMPILKLREIARRFGVSAFRGRAELKAQLPDVTADAFWSLRNEASKRGISMRRSRDELIGLLKQKGVCTMEDAQTVTPEPAKPEPRRERPKPPAAPVAKVEPSDPDPAQDGTPEVDNPVPTPQSGMFGRGNPDLVDAAKLAKYLGVTIQAVDAARAAGIVSWTRGRGPALVSGGTPVAPRVLQGLFRISETPADARQWLRSWVSPVRTEAAPSLQEAHMLLPCSVLGERMGVSEAEMLRLITEGRLPAWPVAQADGQLRWHSFERAFRHCFVSGRAVAL